VGFRFAADDVMAIVFGVIHRLASFLIAIEDYYQHGQRKIALNG
jgi:hypothetical protein